MCANTAKTAQSLSFVPEPLSIEDSSLWVTHGPHAGKRLALDKELIVIGRAEWCDLVLDQDPLVSSRHCQLIIEERGARILDQRSSNGTLLGGQPIIEAYLKPQVPIQIGDSILELRTNTLEKKQIFLQCQDDSGTLVGKSPPMRRLFDWMARIGPNDASVLLTGETGTGKTQIARALHMLSGRDGAFVEVNCGALPANLIEGLLFGYEKGAFTGASQQHEGFFQQADGGTLFLDEIGELPLELQPKLLRALESGAYRRLGGKRDLNSDFRLLTATHRDLSLALKEGRFRQDLYFRIGVIKLDVPPLRQRPEDLPLLCAAIFEQIAGETPPELSPEALRKLQSYVWPGNVRELRSVLERCVVLLEKRVIEPDDLLFDFADERRTSPEVEAVAPHEAPRVPRTAFPESMLLNQAMTALAHELRDESLQGFMDRMEAFILQHTLNQQGSVQEAARHLGVSRGLIYKRIHKYGLEIP